LTVIEAQADESSALTASIISNPDRQARLDPVTRLDPAAREQDEEDEQDEAHSTTRAVTPVTTMRPRWNGTQQHQDGEHKQNRDHRFFSSGSKLPKHRLSRRHGPFCSLRHVFIPRAMSDATRGFMDSSNGMLRSRET
jgi:hypothetical protein